VSPKNPVTLKRLGPTAARDIGNWGSTFWLELKMGHLKLGKANAIKRSAQLNYWLPFNISSIVNGLKQPRNLSLLGVQAE
jgi:hypothetical protein